MQQTTGEYWDTWNTVSVLTWLADTTLIFRCLGFSIRYNKTLWVKKPIKTFVLRWCDRFLIFYSASSHSDVLGKSFLHHWLTPRHVSLPHVWRVWAVNRLSLPLQHCEWGPFVTVIFRLFPLSENCHSPCS